MTVGRMVLLVAVLAAYWLLNSGHYTGFVMTLGAISVIGSALLTRRLLAAAGQSTRERFNAGFAGYLVYLLVEIVKANIDVIKRVLDPDLPISPRLFRLPLGPRTEIGRVLYAQSITLTPGTVVTDMGDDWIEVHALSKDGEDGLRTGDMDRRVCAVEGRA